MGDDDQSFPSRALGRPGLAIRRAVEASVTHACRASPDGGQQELGSETMRMPRTGAGPWIAAAPVAAALAAAGTLKRLPGRTAMLLGVVAGADRPTRAAGPRTGR